MLRKEEFVSIAWITWTAIETFCWLDWCSILGEVLYWWLLEVMCQNRAGSMTWGCWLTMVWFGKVTPWTLCSQHIFPAQLLVMCITDTYFVMRDNFFLCFVKSPLQCTILKENFHWFEAIWSWIWNNKWFEYFWGCYEKYTWYNWGGKFLSQKDKAAERHKKIWNS